MQPSGVILKAVVFCTCRCGGRKNEAEDSGSGSLGHRGRLCGHEVQSHHARTPPDRGSGIRGGIHGQLPGCPSHGPTPQGPANLLRCRFLQSRRERRATSPAETTRCSGDKGGSFRSFFRFFARTGFARGRGLGIPGRRAGAAAGTSSRSPAFARSGLLSSVAGTWRRRLS